jgi:hypothetical protein
MCQCRARVRLFFICLWWSFVHSSNPLFLSIVLMPKGKTACGGDKKMRSDG